MAGKIISCPKCGFEQESTEECRSCGIIFHKFQKRQDSALDKPEASSGPENKKAIKGSGKTFKIVRIAILLFLLFITSMSALISKMRTTDWDKTLRVVVYPINGDGSNISSDYIGILDETVFKPVADFVAYQAKQYSLGIDLPVAVELGPVVDEIPPEPPQNGNWRDMMWWTLKMRYWAFCVDPQIGPAEEVQMFVLYYNPWKYKRLAHSLGLEKGLICVVHAYAEKRREAQNNVVITHELLHTFGATDKYDLATEQPIYPYGYAEPDKVPLFPQDKAEIMGGGIALSKTRAIIPDSLDYAVIGHKTASEIKWIE